MARLTPEARAKLDAFKAVKVRHPHLDTADRLLSHAIEEHAGYTHVLLYGPSGVGKSTVTRRIAERFVASESDRAVVPVVWVEARPSDTGVYARLDYYRQVLTALREHVAVKDQLMNLALSTKPSRSTREATDWLDLREAVEYALERLRVKAVVIDEAQHLMQVAPPHRPVDQLDWLKSMTNRTQVLHVLVGPYELFDFRNLNGQAARRGRDIHFPRYRMEQPDDRLAFVGAVRFLLEHAPVPCDIDAILPQWRWLAEASAGCIGIVRDWLVATVAELVAEGAPLTLEALQRAALQPAQRLRLELDARSGEQKVDAANAETQRQLQALLGPLVGAAAPAEGGGDAAAPSAPAPHPARRARIERAPQRDPVGDQTPAIAETRCSFAGIIDLSAAQMAEVGISKVECPTCATLRTIQPRGDTVRFPAHPKRKTTRPTTEPRWINDGTTWRLSTT
jgi:hypothetical protein